MEKVKPLLPHLLLLVVAIIVITLLFPSVHPNSAIVLHDDAKTVIQRSRYFLERLHIDLEPYTPDAQVRMNRPLIRQAQRELGFEQANVILRDSLPAYFWRVRWMPKEKEGSIFRTEGRSEEEQLHESERMLRGEISVSYDLRGNLIGYERMISDSARIVSLPPEQAKMVAMTFAREIGGIASLSDDTVNVPPSVGSLQYTVRMSGTKVESEKRIEQPHRTDFEYVWASHSGALGNKVLVRVGVAGDAVARYAVEYQVPEQYKDIETQLVSQIATVVLYAAAILMMIVIAFQRIRSFEIGFKLGAVIGGVAAVLLGAQLYLMLSRELGWEIVFPVVLGPLFVGGALVLVWAVSESIVREVWKEKFVSVDLISKGYVWHSRVGQSIIRGVSLGAMSFALWLLLVKIGGNVTNFWMILRDENISRAYDSISPTFHILSSNFVNHVYVFSIFVLFVISLLRKRIHSTPLIVLLAAVVLSVTNREDLQPWTAGLMVHMGTGALLAWTFIRYDALSAFLTLWTFHMSRDVATLFNVGNETYVASALVLLSLFVFLLLIGFVTLARRDEITDFDSIVPRFARHITERQRLQQELEIARQVQMSFLPKSYPTAPRLDIASRCAPALEVGGDYFDFIELPDARIGVAVGDVSGKGTQAAFFMTLTKGFLRALAKVSDSPAAILTQVNRLFYENVERGVFISMAYGVFDTKANELRFARAGHNPLLMRKRQQDRVQIVSPMGLALGLDQGEAFERSIQEISIPFQAGDLFVFYTDGFPEAMNKTMEEFGEERLCKIIERYAQGSASEILDGVFREIKEFTGKAKQHDDMTIVVVKIVERNSELGSS
jgi:MFS family permease